MLGLQDQILLHVLCVCTCCACCVCVLCVSVCSACCVCVCVCCVCLCVVCVVCVCVLCMLCVCCVCLCVVHVVCVYVCCVCVYVCCVCVCVCVRVVYVLCVLYVCICVLCVCAVCMCVVCVLYVRMCVLCVCVYVLYVCVCVWCMLCMCMCVCVRMCATTDHSQSSPRRRSQGRDCPNAKRKDRELGVQVILKSLQTNKCTPMAVVCTCVYTNGCCLRLCVHRWVLSALIHSPLIYFQSATWLQYRGPQCMAATHSHSSNAPYTAQHSIPPPPRTRCLCTGPLLRFAHVTH